MIHHYLCCRRELKKTQFYLKFKRLFLPNISTSFVFPFLSIQKSIIHIKSYKRIIQSYKRIIFLNDKLQEALFMIWFLQYQCQTGIVKINQIINSASYNLSFKKKFRYIIIALILNDNNVQCIAEKLFIKNM